MHGPDSAVAGSLVTFTVIYHNSGHDNDDDCEIEHHMHHDFDFVSASPGGSYDPSTGTVSWQTGPLAPGASYSVTVTERVSSATPHGSVLTNMAYLGLDGIGISPAAFQTVLVP